MKMINQEACTGRSGFLIPKGSFKDQSELISGFSGQSKWISTTFREVKVWMILIRLQKFYKGRE